MKYCSAFWIGLLLQLGGCFYTLAQELSFHHLTVEQGLSNANVNHFLHDSQGFMWIATDEGLNRYDGYSFKVYKHEARNPYSLSSSDAKRLFEDSQGYIWIGSNFFLDLCRYDRKTNHFLRVETLEGKRLTPPIEDENGYLWAITGHKLLKISIKTLKIGFIESLNQKYTFISVIKGSGNTFWLFTKENQILKFDPQTLQVQEYENNFKTGQGIEFNKWNIVDFHVDKQERVWIAFRGKGLMYLDTKTKTVFSYKVNTKLSSDALSDSMLLSTKVDGDIFYLGTENKGVSILDMQTNVFRHFPHDNANPQSPIANSTHAVYVDKQKRLWVGSFSGGVSVADPLQERFAKSAIPLKNSSVNAILEDSKGRLWIGTEGGITVKIGEQIKYYVSNPLDKNGLRTNPVLSIIEDAKQRIWVGTWEGGLHQFDEKTDSFINYSTNSQSNAPISDNKVMNVFAERRTGQIFASGYFNGLNVLTSEEKGEFENFRTNPKDSSSISYDMVSRVFQNSQGQIWVGTQNGLNLFDPTTKKFKRYQTNKNIPQSLSNNFISFLYEDSKKRFWVGTNEGLNLWIGEGKFKHYLAEDGLPNDCINGILEDSKGNLWISTNNGIAKFDPDKNTFHNYDQDDGLAGKQFKANACFKSKSGIFYFGGIKGITIFHPDSIKDNPNLPPVIITDFKIFNKSVAIGTYDSMLKQTIQHQQEVTLTHEHSVFSFDFVGLNFTQSDKNKYAYRLIPFEKNWNYISGNQRSATYTNLSAGTYTFEVKASNNDGLWNEKGTAIAIRILPPWWATWWFRSIAIILFFGSGIVFYVVRTRFLQKQNRRLEQMVNLRTLELKNTNEELNTTQEELRQNMEELETNQELLQQQKDTIESAFQQLNVQNTRVNDSIRYAQRIQNAILPHEDVLKTAFVEHFVIYKPKDVVSGDFYWYFELNLESKNLESGMNTMTNDELLMTNEKRQTTNNQQLTTNNQQQTANYSKKRFLAVVDCTGHGVPGAFMSMIGNTLLREIIESKQITEPADILIELNQRVIQSLNRRDRRFQDGMDIALCMIEDINENLVLVKFSGAKRPLFYFETELKEINASRASIGQHVDAVFSQESLFLPKGKATLYMTSDGWSDTINPTRKRWGSQALKNMLLQGAFIPLEAQKTLYLKELNSYQQGAEQRDDVLMVGVRV